MIKDCDENCNRCPIMNHENSRKLTKIFNKLYREFGSEVRKIINMDCPNMTVCYDCKIDDFCHVENCEFINKFME